MRTYRQLQCRLRPCALVRLAGRLWMKCFIVPAVAVLALHTARAVELGLPARPADAPKGSALAEAIASLDRNEREQRIAAEILHGNIPRFLRACVPVSLTNVAGTASNTVTLFVAPDYLAVGADDDYFLTPLSPAIAQQIAGHAGCALPTRKMVDAIHQAAPVKLAPAPLTPGPDMVTVAVFRQHNDLVRAQRATFLPAQPLGTLVAGHKKDVVISPRVATAPGKVAIYGWHRTNGTPIQPLFLGHAASWVDYSHGVRLVAQTALLNGHPKPVADLLADPALAALLSDEGPMAAPTYRFDAGPPPASNTNAAGRAEPPRPRSELPANRAWKASPHFGEQTLNFTFEPGVRIHVNAPSAAALAAHRRLRLVLYALPNGNTIEQTLGRQSKPGDDWHFDIQHIGAQARWLRAHDTNAALVLACLETAEKSWPAWRRKNSSGRLPDVVTTLAGLFPAHERSVVLSGHSGGGSFIFGYLEGVPRIPDTVERIMFLDGNYAYDATKGHAAKLAAWLKSAPAAHLCVLAYNDAVALLNGKPFVSAAGGTWGRSHAMIEDLAKEFAFQSETNGTLAMHRALAGRIQFLLKENPERVVLHTVLVERNGFIHALLSGTPLESRGYQYLGPRAYAAFIPAE